MRVWLTWLFVLSVEPVLVASLFQQVRGATRKTMSALNVVVNYKVNKVHYEVNKVKLSQKPRKQVINRNIAIVSNYEGYVIISIK